MSIKKYETLLKTVDTGSLTRASEELGYTQSAISQLISGMEDDMGLKLLIRDRSGVRLTETGAQLIPSIRAVCEANEQVNRRVAELQGMALGSIRIGSIGGSQAAPLAQHMRSFQAEHPVLHFELLHGSAEEIERWLFEGRIDCGIAYETDKPQLTQITLQEESLLAVFSAEQQVETGDFSLEQIGKETVLLLREGHAPALRAYLKKSATQACVQYSGQDDASVLALVAAGFGMSILPESAIAHSGFHLICRSCLPALKRNICLIYLNKKTMTPLLRQFIRTLAIQAEAQAER